MLMTLDSSWLRGLIKLLSSGGNSRTVVFSVISSRNSQIIQNWISSADTHQLDWTVVGVRCSGSAPVSCGGNYFWQNANVLPHVWGSQISFSCQVFADYSSFSEFGWDSTSSLTRSQSRNKTLMGFLFQISVWSEEEKKSVLTFQILLLLLTEMFPHIIFKLAMKITCGLEGNTKDNSFLNKYKKKVTGHELIIDLQLFFFQHFNLHTFAEIFLSFLAAVVPSLKASSEASREISSDSSVSNVCLGWFRLNINTIGSPSPCSPSQPLSRWRSCQSKRVLMWSCGTERVLTSVNEAADQDREWAPIRQELLMCGQWMRSC